MNQVFITGRIKAIEDKHTYKNIMIETYDYEPECIDYIPATINENSKVHIGYLRKGDLISLVGKLKFESNGIIVIVELMNYAG